jgi:hypothetical protein
MKKIQELIIPMVIFAGDIITSLALVEHQRIKIEKKCDNIKASG